MPATRALELIELPELGSGADADGPPVTSEAAIAETIEMVDVPVQEGFVPAPLQLVEHTAEPSPAAKPALATIAESDDIAIGDVTLSRSLWKILSDEADEHVATLEHELSILQFDLRAVPRADMVRASHTLCGIHRTGGFPLVAVTARALEQTLIALEQIGPPLRGTAYPVLARAIAGLAMLVARVKAQEPFTRGDIEEAGAIQRELEEVRQDAAAEASDAEAAAEEIARLEDSAAPDDAALAVPVSAAATTASRRASPGPTPLRGSRTKESKPRCPSRN